MTTIHTVSPKQTWRALNAFLGESVTLSFLDTPEVVTGTITGVLFDPRKVCERSGIYIRPEGNGTPRLYGLDEVSEVRFS